ncbi:hypothetical protein V2G26_018189 [Clonostachys chloroleuca]
MQQTSQPFPKPLPFPKSRIMTSAQKMTTLDLEATRSSSRPVFYTKMSITPASQDDQLRIGNERNDDPLPGAAKPIVDGAIEQLVPCLEAKWGFPIPRNCAITAITLVL